MSKLNPHVKTSKFDTVKLAGGSGLKAAKQDNISNLRRCVLANLLWENNAYVNGVEVGNEIARLIPLCNPDDVASLAIEARIVQKLRHTPLFICVQMLKHKTHAERVKAILPVICTRADMLTDCLALYWKLNPQRGTKNAPIANSLKEGLALAFANFNEYQFAKYDRDGEVKLRDVMFLVKPKPVQGKEELYSKIADRKLDAPDTWEVALSTGKDKRLTWERLIEEKKIGGLAMLRNLKNMREANVPRGIIEKGLKELKSTMLLPLNFLSAARMNPELERQIEDAMIGSYATLPKLPGRTLFILDISGSMGSKLSGKTDFNRQDAACAMAMLAANQCEDYELVLTAGNDGTRIGAHMYVPYPKKGFGMFQEPRVGQSKIGGGGIFTRQCLEWCKANLKGEFDRIIVFSDSQDCDIVNRVPKPFAKANYIVDVSAEKRGINYAGAWDAEISGFSEHFITYIAAYEGLDNSFEEE